MITYQQRVDREVDQLKGCYTVHSEKIKDGKTCVYVYDERNRYIKMYLQDIYPFKPPKVIIVKRDNEEEYISLYQKLACFYIKELRIYKKDDYFCICCNNMIKNWSPIRRLIHVVNECRQIEDWFYDLRSAYYGMKVLNKKENLYKDIITMICSYIYAPYI
jgi:hypothetical protein